VSANAIVAGSAGKKSRQFLKKALGFASGALKETPLPQKGLGAFRRAVLQKIRGGRV
jgi:hypothetical protein